MPVRLFVTVKGLAEFDDISRGYLTGRMDSDRLHVVRNKDHDIIVVFQCAMSQFFGPTPRKILLIILKVTDFGRKNSPTSSV